MNSEERVQAIEDLGLLNEDPVLKLNTPLDTLTHYLSNKLTYQKHERDLIVLRHDIEIVWPDNRREERGINFVLYGDTKGHSAMSRTVGYPAAVGTKMILDGKAISGFCDISCFYKFSHFNILLLYFEPFNL